MGRRGGGSARLGGAARLGGTRFPGSGTRFGGGAASHGCFERDAAFFSDGGGDRDDAFFLRGPAKPHGFRPLNGGGAGAGAGAGARATFRGRQLRGRDLELPAGTVAARLRGGAGGAGLEVAQVLGRVVLWNHDAEVSPADPLPRAVEWLGMAEAVHGPVRLEEVEAALAEEPAPAPAA